MFEEFWSRFPRKVAKDAALKAWKKRGVPPELHARMLEAIDRQRDSVDWTKDGGQFIPHPATWINGAGWLNELRPRASPVAGQPVTAQQQIEYLRVRIAEEEEREQNRNAEDRADAPYRLAANAG